MNALLVIDAQRNLLEAPTAVHDAAAIVGRLEALILDARASATPVVFVQHCGGPGEIDEPGAPGWEIDPRCAPLTGEPVVLKTRPDAFEGTELEKVLAGRGARRLIVAGVQSDFCVRATCRAAVARGYDVVLVEDAHGTYDGKTSSAPEIVGQINAELAPAVALVRTAEVRFA